MPEQESNSRRKRSWYTLGQLSVWLWLGGVAVQGFSILLYASITRSGKGHQAPWPPVAIAVFLLGAVLVVSVFPVAVVALIKRRKGDQVELLAAITGMMGASLTLLVVINSLLASS